MSGADLAYQWIGHDPGTGTDTEINGATGQTYSVTVRDEGKALKVRVTFTDDAGNKESLTSLAAMVSAPSARDIRPANSPAAGAPV